MTLISKQALVYPLRITDGSLTTETARRNLLYEIMQYVTTVKGERKLLPDFGLPQIVFTSLDSEAVENIILVELTKTFPEVRFNVTLRETADRFTRIVRIQYDAQDFTETIDLNLI